MVVFPTRRLIRARRPLPTHGPDFSGIARQSPPWPRRRRSVSTRSVRRRGDSGSRPRRRSTRRSDYSPRRRPSSGRSAAGTERRNRQDWRRLHPRGPASARNRTRSTSRTRSGKRCPSTSVGITGTSSGTLGERSTGALGSVSGSTRTSASGGVHGVAPTTWRVWTCTTSIRRRRTVPSGNWSRTGAGRNDSERRSRTVWSSVRTATGESTALRARVVSVAGSPSTRPAVAVRGAESTTRSASTATTRGRRAQQSRDC